MLTRIGLPALAITLGAALAFAPQLHAQAPAAEVTANSPDGPVPLASNIPFMLNKDLKWTGTPGRSEQAILWGDPGKAGPYGLLIKWYPGNYSRPHQHNGDRNVYVVSGTWWVSTSNTFDPATTYPMRAGTRVINVANTTHWDGSRAGEKEPGVILLTGIGPVVTTQIGTDGKPLPPAGRGN